MAGLMKWVGSKSKTVDQILPHLSHAKRFVEPFCGTAVVGLAMVARGKCESIRLSDVNARLVHLLEHVRERQPFLEVLLKQRAEQYNALAPAEQEALYRGWVTEFNASAVGSVASALLMLALNRTCFNGLYRENSRGEFNVAWGKHPKLDWKLIAGGMSHVRHTLRQVPTEIVHGSYEAFELRDGDVIYADPPFHLTFGSYNAVKWSDDQQRKLVATLRRWARSAPVFASNSDTELVRDAYRGSVFHEISGKSSVSCQAESRGYRRELLIEVRP